MLKLSQFEAFHAVMTSGSMTEAAKVLNTSQPNIVDQSLNWSKLQSSSCLKDCRVNLYPHPTD